MNRRKGAPGRRDPSAWTVAGCAALAVVGTLVTLSCLLSLYVDVVGFGGPAKDGREGYRALLAVGAVAGLAAPAAVCATVLHTSWRLAVLAVAVVATALAVLFLGIT